MEIHTDEAFVLDVRTLQDVDRIVTFLSHRFGKRDGVAKGARRKHSRYAGQLQPLAKVSITWVEKPGRDLVRISAVEMIQSAHRLQEDLEGILAAAYMADQVSTFVQENEPEDLHFRLLSSTLEALEGGVDQDLASRFFETWILRLAGIFPPPDDCPECGQPLEKAGILPPNGDALLCTECGVQAVGGWKAGPGVLEFLRRTARQKLVRLAQDPPSTKVLRRVEELNGRIRRSFLQSELRSYKVLQQTLGQLGQL